MPILIPAFAAAALAHRCLQAYAPSNAVVARVRRERPHIRVTAGLLVLSSAVALGAFLLAACVTSGGPGWLNTVILIAIWDALKFFSLAMMVFLRWVQSVACRPLPFAPAVLADVVQQRQLRRRMRVPAMWPPPP